MCFVKHKTKDRELMKIIPLPPSEQLRSTNQNNRKKENISNPLQSVLLGCDHRGCAQAIVVHTVLYLLDIVPKFTDIQDAKWEKVPGINKHYCPKHQKNKKKL